MITAVQELHLAVHCGRGKTYQRLLKDFIFSRRENSVYESTQCEISFILKVILYEKTT